MELHGGLCELDKIRVTIAYGTDASSRAWGAAKCQLQVETPYLILNYLRGDHHGDYDSSPTARRIWVSIVPYGGICCLVLGGKSPVYSPPVTVEDGVTAAARTAGTDARGASLTLVTSPHLAGHRRGSLLNFLPRGGHPPSTA